MTAAALVDDWERSGTHLDTPAGRVFVRDVPAVEPDGSPPLLVLHGFPTCSFDFRLVLDELARRRRVVLFDQLGFGLSDKPDRRYGIHLQADTTQHVATALGLGTVDLLTHDMGDSVGGELLARDLAGHLGFQVRRRVLTNGSIYLDLAQLTTGQQLLLSLPDEAADLVQEEGYVTSLANTLASPDAAPREELAAQWELLRRNDGQRLLARTIRYLEDRRAEERRYTGAIEDHPTPLGVVWGAEDPIAVAAMPERLAERVPHLRVDLLEGVGHYPMLEAPEQFAAAVLSHL
ncbi:MAG TPA: alpha/beta hydrolase [Microthrixaceae bacterium]|nr:alpha/beta hydrolase [Microthrixaceae bacterium]